MYSIKQIQRALAFHQLYKGPVDGVRGPMTDAAIVAFKKSIGYKPRPYLGPLTLAALFDGRREILPPTFVEAPSGFTNGKEVINAAVNRPIWLRVASSYLGLKEAKGLKNNPLIVNMFARIYNIWFTDDQTPWCAAFVGSV